MYSDTTVIRRQGDAPEPYPQGFGLGGTTLISGGLASPDPELFSVSNLLPIEKAERFGMKSGGDELFAPLRLVVGALRTEPVDQQQRRIGWRPECLVVDLAVVVVRIRHECDGSARRRR